MTHATFAFDPDDFIGSESDTRPRFRRVEAGPGLDEATCPRCGRDACVGECSTSDVRVYQLADFLRLELPERRPLLVGPTGAPIFREKDSAMIVAARGVGKTWLMDGIALTVATGGRFLKWRAPEPRSVLLIDGEMPAGSLQDRLRALLPMIEATHEPQLRVLAADVQDEPLPSLASPAGQARIEEHLDGIALLMLDNISTLMPTLDENDAAAWGPAQDWLLSLRRRGITTTLAHHAGRAGHARGTSRREDVLDVLLRLVQPSDYAPDQGARFTLHFEKARGISGRDAEPFEVWLQGGAWTLGDIGVKNYESALELFDQGARAGEVAETLGIARATAFRYQRQGRQEGRLDPPKTRASRR